MYEIATDTDYADRPIADEFAAQPNTSAPIAHVPTEQFAIPQRDMSWLTWRVAIGGIGAVVMGALLFVASRGAGNTQTMTVHPPEQEPVNMEKVNEDIIKNNYAKFSELKQVTDVKMDEIEQASINERAQEILIEAKRHVSDPANKNGCYRAFNGKDCYALIFAAEQKQRWLDAISVGQKKKANEALFDFKAARVALDGINPNLPFNPPVAFGAMSNEIDARAKIEDQSQAAIATDLYQGVRKKK
jgi:hypothetical protein